MSLPKYFITGADVLLLCKLEDIFYPEDDHLLKLFKLILAKELKSPTQSWGDVELWLLHETVFSFLGTQIALAEDNRGHTSYLQFSLHCQDFGSMILHQKDVHFICPDCRNRLKQIVYTSDKILADLVISIWILSYLHISQQVLSDLSKSILFILSIWKTTIC